MTEDLLLTVQEAAEQLRISKYQVYRRIARGDLQAITVRRGSIHYLVPHEALQAYIAAGGADVLTPPRPDHREWLPVSEVAILTGFSRVTIRRMCTEGRLPYLRGKGSRGHLRIPRTAVDGLLSKP